jgi:hypothetical protein
MALDLAALTEFNNEVAGTLIPKMVYTGTTMEYVTVKEGIKYKEPINLFEVDLDIKTDTAVLLHQLEPHHSLRETSKFANVRLSTDFA